MYIILMFKIYKYILLFYEKVKFFVYLQRTLLKYIIIVLSFTPIQYRPVSPGT
jgi:hypothetical protein